MGPLSTMWNGICQGWRWEGWGDIVQAGSFPVLGEERGGARTPWGQPRSLLCDAHSPGRAGMGPGISCVPSVANLRQMT